MTSALGGLRVLDLSDSISGGWCTRLMADFGANVVVVEPSEGLAIRALEPKDSNGRSIPATYVLANKQSIALDLAARGGAEVLADLLATADVVVQSASSLTAAALDLDALHEADRKLVSVTISPHGEVGPRAGLPGNDLTAYAWSGWAGVNGRADREPIKGSGFTASLTAGASAYSAVVAALCQRELTGEGQHIDFAETEAMAMIFGRSMLKAQYEEVTPRRNAETEMSATFPAQVADGYLTTAARGGPRLADALRSLDLDELADLIPKVGPGRRAEIPPEVHAGLRAKLTELGREQIFDQLSPLHFSIGPVFDVGELMENRQLRARDYFQSPSEAPEEVEFPGPPFKMTQTPAELRTTAPAIGEHRAEVLRDLAGYDDAKIAALEAAGVVTSGPAA